MSRDNTYVLYFVVEIWFEIVLCFSPPARTINWDTGRTPSISGKVAVTQYSLQGKVCADAWSDNAANVFCRNHGYNGGVAITYQEHTASVDWILTLNCTGDEMSLSECTMNEDINLPCSSTREIGVLCYNAGQYKGKHIQSLSMVSVPGYCPSITWNLWNMLSWNLFIPKKLRPKPEGKIQSGFISTGQLDTNYDWDLILSILRGYWPICFLLLMESLRVVS